MEKLKAICVLVLILAIVALPFVSLHNGYNGEVYVANNAYTDEQLVNLQNTEIQNEKVRVEDNNEESNEYKAQVKVQEIVEDYVPLAAPSKIEIAVNTELVNNDSNIIPSTADDVVAHIKSIMDDVSTQTAFLIESCYESDGDSVVIDADETILPKENDIIDETVPLSNGYNNYEYPEWILGNNEQVIANNEVIENYVVPEQNMVEEFQEIGEDSIPESDGQMCAVANDNGILIGEEYEFEALTKSTYTHDYDFEDASDVIDEVSDMIDPEDIPLGNGNYEHYEYIAEAKNEEIRNFMKMLGFSFDDGETIKDEVIPEGFNEKNKNLMEELNIEMFKDGNSTIYQLPIYHINYINGVPYEQKSTFIVVR